MVSESKCFVLNEPPLTDVNFNQDDANATFKLTTKPLRALEAGELLIKTLYLSNDPTQRAWIQKGLNPDRMYVEPVTQGQVMRSLGLAQIVELKSDKYAAGDIVSTSLQWADYLIIKESAVFNKVADKNVPLPMYLDVLGLTGLTAYFGMLEVAKIKKEDVIVISAALGATGSMCVQIAKNVVGCKKVIGISGGPEKCAYVKLIGADECVDYRSKTFAQDMKAALGEDKYCDVYFDGVGGKVLDTMLLLTKPFGQVIACGAISGYNNFNESRVLNWGQIITQRLTVKGFIILDFAAQYGQAIQELVKWIGEKKIKYDESTFTVVDLSKSDSDFAKIPETWGILFSDKKGPGKLLTKIAQPKL